MTCSVDFNVSMPTETDKSPATGNNTAALWIAVVLVLALSGVLFATAKSKKITSK